MNNFVRLFINPVLLAFFLAFVTTPVVIKFAWKIGIIDDPKKTTHPKTIHTYPVPRGGGLAIFIALALAIASFLPLDSHIQAILLAATFITIIGILDDKYDINPYFRLLAQLVAATIPILAGIGINFINNPFGTGIIDLSKYPILADIFAIFWIVFLMNILNMGAKGVDGQLSGTVAIAAIFIGILSLKFSADIAQWPVIILASITAGAFLGFLPWHIYPQKIMPSFAGSNLAGFMLAILSILSTTKVGTLAVVLGVPIIDTGYTIVRRVLSGKSPVWGDRGHLHHKLLDSGWSKRKVALFYWLVTALLGVISLSLNANLKLYTIVGVAFFVGGLLLWLTYRSK
ncbi:hypothetical protein A3D84_02460 [Candidatus Woesebacteria bacterium RIFCSPHIGHO2_02_FULL_42_20]|uniref:Undecaprenyl-phosphate alpha-N-acetylglucosaminyl 1-phosphate transferase n=1 Tax=Candidatus Woesebacteria bacterium RIFCSPHIGHO2_12_FULL_41_24 TaxID=1802510 RepID=A0A1F8AUK1_9BACT|nr:MAG: hypothetical protein A2W15_02650 [Candidatus Woesebacteria bacterium RBG_16_41_13]OGM29207.1 MAG: hypothetical protein A2873_03005 [Candidatus Woesebacteria bacterium RIFCSPHIGHO2_01_FULL_42_80]OGM34705.1 MAG: hypothetical protein A3D84_02460 [Candidatus Woesebacteria bacterium RIFCSPHIGHO2_02_FULL_42_20]OGM55417.1 MAG: hypothetical protein A3E44_05000 [Candidatus Woesebacteria bacterium RIFCSPHIGHO2_12_FULL_41_24]OGM68159.1 MAG: hypothetical protein A2969_00445 [Candidatus Woesebacteri